MTANKRIDWVDCAKGMAMLLVIAGHTVTNQIIRGSIFSFHMPLFFLLSGYTSIGPKNVYEHKRIVKKTAIKLLLPAYALWATRTALYYIFGRIDYSASQLILTALFSSGVEFTVQGVTVPAFGMLWFLVALFLVRNLYDLILLVAGKKHMAAVSILISAVGILCGQRVFLPFVLDNAMAAFVFFHFGRALQEKEIRPSWSKLGIGIISWGGNVC